MWRRRFLALAALTTALGCAEASENAREAVITNALVGADLAVIRARPGLVAGRYARMATAPYEFYRGSLAVFLRDWRDGAMPLSRSRFALDWPQPLGVGDPHPENFGTLLGADGALRLEVNDLDGADRVPYLWDLRRLTVGLCLAARLANEGDAPAQALTRAAAGDIARAAAAAYAATLAEIARGVEPPPVLDGRGSALLVDLFRRARRDADRRAELAGLTLLRDGRRTLRRGAPDVDDPNNVLVDLPVDARPSLDLALLDARRTLMAPPEPGYFTVLDAARELGSGVASWPRVRVLVLVRGPSDAADDDVVLELKEEGDPISPGSLLPGVWWSAVSQRILAARGLWSREAADPLWGAGAWVGVPVQMRAEREAHKTVRVDRMVDDEGAVDSLRALARTLGTYLARAHTRPLPDGTRTTHAIATVIARDPEGFAREQAEVSEAYATQVVADWAHLRRALATRGPTLGLAPAEGDAPPPDLRALLALDRIPDAGASP
jgi:uncharacterized protein (DUF2252 family)